MISKEEVCSSNKLLNPISPQKPHRVRLIVCTERGSNWKTQSHSTTFPLFVVYFAALSCVWWEFFPTFSLFIHAPFNPVSGTILLSFWRMCFFFCPHPMMREVRLLSFFHSVHMAARNHLTERVLCGTTVVAHTQPSLCSIVRCGFVIQMKTVYSQ